MTKQSTKTLDILERLCAFDTTSYKSNLDCIEYCMEFLYALGFSVDILPNRNGDKANLHAMLGEANKRGIVFAGHTDVVPVDGQIWNTDPFQLDIDKGNATARGVTDMKGFLAIVLSKMSSIDFSALNRPVHILMTYDEESGCFGARDIRDYIKRRIAPGSFCLLGEPTGMVPVAAHKGIKGFRCNILASEGHAAQIAHKSNAIHCASQLTSYLLEQQDYYAEEKQTGNYETPYSTIQVGLINGGIARNMIARECTLEFEFRYVPNDSPDEFVNRLNKFVDNCLTPQLRHNDRNASVSIEILSDVPAFLAANGQMLTCLQESWSLKEVTHWDGVTEAGYYAHCGLDTIVCGPGSLSQAHQPNECIPLSELAEFESRIDRLLEHLSE